MLHVLAGEQAVAFASQPGGHASVLRAHGLERRSTPEGGRRTTLVRLQSVSRITNRALGPWQELDSWYAPSR